MEISSTKNDLVMVSFSGLMESTILANGKKEIGMEQAFGPIDMVIVTMVDGRWAREKAMESTSLEGMNTRVNL